MDEVELLEWAALGVRLREVDQGSFDDVMRHLREVVKAQETIARLDREVLGGDRVDNPTPPKLFCV